MHFIVHEIISATEGAMECAMDDSQPDVESIGAELLSGMAATVGVTLSAERAEALATQAGPHFTLLRAIDGLVDPATEPAAEFHLDEWTGRADG